MSRRYLEATTWLCDEIEPVVVDGRLDFPESTYEQMLVSFQVGVDHSTNALLPGYLVTEDAAERIVRWAAETSGYFEAVAQICATNLELGTSLPQPLRTFASQVLPHHEQQQFLMAARGAA